MEEWRPVVDWEESYVVSNMGRVRSIDRVVVSRDGSMYFTRVGKLMTATRWSKYGHLSVYLRRPGMARRVSVHKLVAAAFLGSCPVGLEVRHRNGNPQVNTVQNLLYGTRAENMRDSVDHGTHNQARKTHCPRNHLLKEPNLDGYALPRRACTACRVARNRFHNVGIAPTLKQLQNLSDEIYATLMERKVS